MVNNNINILLVSNSILWFFFCVTVYFLLLFSRNTFWFIEKKSRSHCYRNSNKSWKKLNKISKPVCDIAEPPNKYIKISMSYWKKSPKFLVANEWCVVAVDRVLCSSLLMRLELNDARGRVHCIGRRRRFLTAMETLYCGYWALCACAEWCMKCNKYIRRALWLIIQNYSILNMKSFMNDNNWFS